SLESSGSSRRNVSRAMNLYSAGSGAWPERYMTESLPSSSSTSFAARIDPRASPSGFSCVMRRKRSFVRSASATAVRSLVVVWGELIDQVRHADAALDGVIVLKRQLRSPFHSELACDPPLEHTVRGLQPRERLLALLLRPEDADEDVRLAQVGRRFDPGDGDEPDPQGAGRAEHFGEDFLHCRVDATHSVTHRGPPPPARH